MITTLEDWPASRVIKDRATGDWRVVCPIHGELARYLLFWRAAHDAHEHDSVCGVDDE